MTLHIKNYEFIKHIKAPSFFFSTYTLHTVKTFGEIYNTSIESVLKKRYNPLHYST